MNDLTVGVIGLGRLGLPLAAVVSQNYKVIGVDVNIRRINELQTRSYKHTEPSLNELIDEAKNKIEFHTNYTALEPCNVIFIVVPTPSDSTGMFDNSYLLRAFEDISGAIKRDNLFRTFVVVSTVMPGSTSGELKYKLLNRFDEQSFNLVYCPQFIALGSVIKNLQNPDVVIYGCERPEAAEVVKDIMSRHIVSSARHLFMKPTDAEIAKIAINSFVTMKISYANMISEICSCLPDTNTRRVLEAIGLDTRVGLKYLAAGPGYAGPCLPRDNVALAAFSSRFSLRADLPKASDEINARQYERLAQWILQRTSNQDSISIFGVSFKENSDSVEASFSVYIANILSEFNRNITVHDIFIDRLNLDQSLNQNIRRATSVLDAIENASHIVLMHRSEIYNDEILSLAAQSGRKISVLDVWGDEYAAFPASGTAVGS